MVCTGTAIVFLCYISNVDFAGSFAENLGSLDEAMAAYDHALKANPNSTAAMNGISLILRTREEFAKAAEYLQLILKLEPSNGEAWGSLGTFGGLS